MDNFDKTVNILRTYKVFSDIRIDNGKVFFRYLTRDYGIFIPENVESDWPKLYVIGDADYSLPHIMAWKSQDGFRYVCLRQDGTYVNFLFSFEEKIRDLCDRLIELMGLSESEKEEEFHKEFMYYWNEASTSSNGLEIYIVSAD